MLTIDQAAAQLGISRRTVQRMLADGRLVGEPPVTLATQRRGQHLHRCWLIPVYEVERIMKGA
jgi:predicted DNA-binding transcriptional regulator YafY